MSPEKKVHLQSQGSEHTNGGPPKGKEKEKEKEKEPEVKAGPKRWAQLLFISNHPPVDVVHDSCVLGKAATCHVRFTEKSISDQHCRIFRENGVHQLEVLRWALFSLFHLFTN